ncbi:MAG: hypothetical protein WA220_06025 [Candidatus Nitrosopolaris sp.]
MTHGQKKKEAKPDVGDRLKDAGIRSNASIKYTDNLDKNIVTQEPKTKETKKTVSSN